MDDRPMVTETGIQWEYSNLCNFPAVGTAIVGAGFAGGRVLGLSPAGFVLLDPAE